MKKEFGKLSTQQVIDFYSCFCKFCNETFEYIQSTEKVELAPDQHTVRWYKLYESNLNQVTASLVSLIGMEEEIKKAITLDDPQEHIIDLLKNDYASPLEKEDVSQETLANIIGHIICLVMHGICIAAYRIDLYKLLQEAKAGHKESFFKAVNIDQCIVNTEAASILIAKTVLEDDLHFFEDLSKAIKGSYPKQTSLKYPLLNFFVYLIEDAAGDNFIDKEELHRLFTEQIPLYPDVTKLEDSFGSFKTQMRRMKHKVKDKKT
jgi:hypothetical protein